MKNIFNKALEKHMFKLYLPYRKLRILKRQIKRINGGKCRIQKKYMTSIMIWSAHARDM